MCLQKAAGFLLKKKNKKHEKIDGKIKEFNFQ
jgi:hypothetical protein